MLRVLLVQVQNSWDQFWDLFVQVGRTEELGGKPYSSYHCHSQLEEEEEEMEEEDEEEMEMM